MSPEKSSGISLETLIECFADLPDPRIDRCKRNKMINIVVIGLCAVIRGAESHTNMELSVRPKRNG
jgi:DDE_Tnp_1-associated